LGAVPIILNCDKGLSMELESTHKGIFRNFWICYQLFDKRM